MSPGFTLLEMTIASLILIVGLLSLLSLILFALKMRFDSKLSSTALKLSQQVVEEFKSRSPEDPILQNPGNSLTPDGAIDFNSSAEDLASKSTVLKLNLTRNTVWVFDTRWNIRVMGGKKIITVATRKTDGSSSQFSPVNLKIALPVP